MLPIYQVVKKRLLDQGKLPFKWTGVGKAPGPAKYVGYKLTDLCTEENTKDLESKHIFYGATTGNYTDGYPVLYSNFGDISFENASSWEFGTSFVWEGRAPFGPMEYVSPYADGSYPYEYYRHFAPFNQVLSGDGNISFRIYTLKLASRLSSVACNFASSNTQLYAKINGERVWFRCRFDGEAYYFEYKMKKDANYTTYNSVAASDGYVCCPISGGIAFGAAPVVRTSSSNKTFRNSGPVYLDDTYFNMNGELLWVPFENPAEE